METPILHFTREEFAVRQKAACAAMAEQGLDGLVMFRQESMYYLTGYDTSGYTMFQALYLGADGRVVLLTRTADKDQSRVTSIIDDIRLWYDRDGANPGEDLRDMLESLGAPRTARAPRRCGPPRRQGALPAAARPTRWTVHGAESA